MKVFFILYGIEVVWATLCYLYARAIQTHVREHGQLWEEPPLPWLGLEVAFIIYHFWMLIVFLFVGKQVRRAVVILVIMLLTPILYTLPTIFRSVR